MSDQADIDRHGAGLWSAALTAEQMTGDHEESIEEAQRHLLWRFARTGLGFFLIVVGIIALPLPGPGWLIILIGLDQLPFRWARNMIRLIRSKIPGIPDDGRIPPRSLVVMGAIVVGASIASYFWAEPVATWFSDRWTQVFSFIYISLDALGVTR